MYESDEVELPDGIEVDTVGGKMYWTARKAGCLYVADMDKTGMDGASFSPIVTGLHAPIGVCLDHENKRLFYTDVIFPASGALWESELDGSNPKQIAAAPLPCGLYFVA